MITLLPVPREDVIGVRMEGRLERADLERIAEEVERRLPGRGRISLYLEIPRFEGMSSGAFLRNLAFSLRHVRDFEREAVVSDVDWIRSFIRAGNRLLPSVEARCFGSDERERALSWVLGAEFTGTEPRPKEPPPVS